MKKIIAFLFVCGVATAFVSCGQKSETSEGTTTDTSTVVEPAVVDAPPISTDSATVAPVDTTIVD